VAWKKQACGSENSKKSVGEQKCTPVARTQVTGHKKTAQKKAFKKNLHNAAFP
jgi:hypothetical protein